MSNPDLARLRASSAAAAADPKTSASLAAVCTELVRVIDAYQPPDDTTPPIVVTPTTLMIANITANSITASWLGDATGWTASRSGTDTTGSGPWSAAITKGQQSITFTKLTPASPYTITLRSPLGAGLAAGARTLDSTTPTIPDPPNTERRIPLIGASKLPFNLTVFQPNKGRAGLQATAGILGRPNLDGVLTFPGRATWDQLKAGLAEVRDVYQAGGIVIYSMPHAPTSEGNNMNANGTRNAYATQQRDFAAYAASQGFTSSRFVIRLDWEWNGNWYPWNSATNGGAAAFKAAFRNAVTNYRLGGLPNVRIGLCNNKGPSQTGHKVADVWPGADVCDVIGVDQYDQYSPAISASQWAIETTKSPALATNIADARKYGVMWSVDECGPIHISAGGGDSAAYANLLAGTIKANAQSCAWWNIYNDPGAPSANQHQLSANPRYTAAIKAALA